MNSSKRKFLLLGLLPLVALSFFLGHFWSYTVCTLAKAIAAGMVLFLVFSKLLAGVTGMPFLL